MVLSGVFNLCDILVKKWFLVWFDCLVCFLVLRYFWVCLVMVFLSKLCCLCILLICCLIVVCIILKLFVRVLILFWFLIFIG